MGVENDDGPDIPELYGDLVAGDDRAWERVAPRLYRYAMAVACAKVRGAEYGGEREDLVQRVVVEFCEGVRGRKIAWERNPPGWGDFRALVAERVRLRAKDFFRGKGRDRLEVVEVLPEPEAGGGDGEMGGIDPERVWQMVGRLRPDPPVPDLVRGSFFEGVSYKELGGRFAMDAATVCRRLRAALQQLGVWLKSEVEEG